MLFGSAWLGYAALPARTKLGLKGEREHSFEVQGRSSVSNSARPTDPGFALLPPSWLPDGSFVAHLKKVFALQTQVTLKVGSDAG